MSGKQIDFLINGLMDENGKPLNGAVVKFYRSGTSIPHNVWGDAGLTQNLGPTVPLDSKGRVLVFNDGLYDLKIVIEEPDGNTTYPDLHYKVSGSELDDKLNHDGSNPMTGDLNLASNNLNNGQDINAQRFISKFGGAWVPNAADQIVMGGGNGYFSLRADGELSFYDDDVLKWKIDSSGHLVSSGGTVKGLPESLANGEAVRHEQHQDEITNRTNADSLIQAELDATQTGAGLTTTGTYSPDLGSNYLSSATSLFNAEILLDIKIKELFDKIGVANGLAPTDSNNLIPTIYLPALALTNVSPVADIAARDALTVEEGDVAIVADNGSGEAESFIYDGSSWHSLKSGDEVLSVFGRTGVVSALAGDYSNDLIINTSSVSGSMTKDALETLDSSKLNKAGDVMTGTGMITLGSGTPSGNQAAKHNQIPTAVSQLSNDSNYQNETQVNNLIVAANTAAPSREAGNSSSTTGISHSLTNNITGAAKDSNYVTIDLSINTNNNPANQIHLDVSKLPGSTNWTITGGAAHGNGAAEEGAASNQIVFTNDGTITIDIVKVNDDSLRIDVSQTLNVRIGIAAKVKVWDY